LVYPQKIEIFNYLIANVIFITLLSIKLILVYILAYNYLNNLNNKLYYL